MAAEQFTVSEDRKRLVTASSSETTIASRIGHLLILPTRSGSCWPTTDYSGGRWWWWWWITVVQGSTTDEPPRMRSLLPRYSTYISGVRYQTRKHLLLKGYENSKGIPPPPPSRAQKKIFIFEIVSLLLRSLVFFPVHFTFLLYAL